MARNIPACPKAPAPARADQERLDLEVRLVTPLFGGGVEAGVPDPVTPIRGCAIRGQLRFWWRVTRGPTCKTPEELRARETEVWGSDEFPSPVSVTIGNVQLNGLRDGESFGFRVPLPESYALFPAI